MQVSDGQEVEVDYENGKIAIRPLIDVKKFSSELKGCISESDLHPLEVKKESSGVRMEVFFIIQKF